jgi:hypothetical protein
VAALSTTPSQPQHIPASTTPNSSSSGSSVAAPVLPPSGEPPTALRQNGDGTEAPPAPPKIPPIFDANSESVPVDGKAGTESITQWHWLETILS